MITVNGENKVISLPSTLGDFLEKEDYNVLKIAVEKNGEIIPKKDYNTCQLNDGDHLEVVTFVGGG